MDFIITARPPVVTVALLCTDSYLYRRISPSVFASLRSTTSPTAPPTDMATTKKIEVKSVRKSNHADKSRARPPLKTEKPAKTKHSKTDNIADKSRSKHHKEHDHHHRSHHHHHKTHTHGKHTHKSRADDKATTPPKLHTSTHRSKHRHHPHPHTELHPSSSLGRGMADPIFIAILALLAVSAFILFAVGVWLLATQNGWPLGLNNTGSTTWTRLISYGTACVIVALVLLPVIIFGILDALAKRGAQARVTRICVTFLSSFLFIILVLMSVTGILFATNSPSFISNTVSQGWSYSVVNLRTVPDVCYIQSKYTCRGWTDDSCLNCNPTVNGLYGACQPSQQLVCPRCAAASPVQVPTSAPVQNPPTTAPQLPQPVQSPDQSSTANSAPQEDVLLQRALVNSSTLTPSSRQGSNTQQTVRVRGCQPFVLRRYREFFIPMTVYTLFLSLLLIVLIWKACVDSAGM